MHHCAPPPRSSPTRSSRGACIVALVFALGGGAARADLVSCRAALLTALDPPAALAACDAAVLADPAEPRARLLRALARIGSLPFQPAVDALADAYGLADDGRFPPDADLLLATGDLAPDSPPPSALQAIVASDVIPALDAALADLAAIASPFTLDLTADEMSSFGVTSIESVEVDESDALLLASLLQLARGTLLIAGSYDVDFDLDDAVLRFDSTLDIQTEIVAAHPALGSTRPDASQRMAVAKQSLCAAVDAYHLGMAAIRAEADPQADDLIAIANPAQEAQASEELARLRAALDRPYRVLVGTERWKQTVRAALNERLGTAFGSPGATLDLRGLFDAPASVRALLPVFSFDPVRAPPNRITSFPDPSFAGALTSAPPTASTSAAPCPPAVVPEAGTVGSALAAFATLAGLARRGHGRRRGRRREGEAA